MKYYGQYLQDQFLNENIFKSKRGGFFLEMGADDGIKHSNTLFFEQELGWNGICIEPREAAFNDLVKNRKCICENICVAKESGEKKFMEVVGYADQLSGLVDNFDKEHVERIEKEVDGQATTKKIINVNCLTLNDIFKKHNVTKIDYFSLDIEGGELDILKSIDLQKTPIDVLSIENNYQDKDTRKFLIQNNYKMVKKIGIDEIYIHQNAGLPDYHEPFDLKNFIREKKNEIIRKTPKGIKDFTKKIIGK